MSHEYYSPYSPTYTERQREESAAAFAEGRRLLREALPDWEDTSDTNPSVSKGWLKLETTKYSVTGARRYILSVQLFKVVSTGAPATGNIQYSSGYVPGLTNCYGDSIHEVFQQFRRDVMRRLTVSVKEVQTLKGLLLETPTVTVILSTPSAAGAPAVSDAPLSLPAGVALEVVK
jgi:hypothetical protein